MPRPRHAQSSHDGGLTWPEAQPILRGDGYAISPDHPWLVVNPKTDTVHVAFLDYIGGNRCYVVNVRPGQVETVPILVPGGAGCLQAAVLSDGTLVVSGDGAVAGGGQWFAASSDDGHTFSAPVSGFALPPFAYLTADPRPGNLTLYGVAADGKEVVLHASGDAGRTWRPPVTLHKSDGDVSLPKLAVAADGSLHVFFLDAGYDPGHLDASHAWSTDGGATWSVERLTTKSWDPQMSHHQNGDAGWVGDYLGADAGPDAVWAAFPDGSLGEAPSLAVAKVVYG
ncbi:MAG: glycoside hydrolase [Halobacteriales archaeon]|nr:glycoside hydrolase [Halobacteriales archaeon]